MRHPDLGCSLSDHFAVEATLSFEPTQSHALAASRNGIELPKQQLAPPTSETANIIKPEVINEIDTLVPGLRDSMHNGTYLQSPTSSSFQDDSASKKNRISMDEIVPLQHHHAQLPESVYDELLDLIDKYRVRERAQMKYRALHFYIALLLTIGCLVGVWFVGNRTYIGFILVLVSSLNLTAGTIDGLLALLFFRGELKTLTEFEWEVRNAQAFGEALSASVSGGSGGIVGGWLAGVRPVRLGDGVEEEED